MSSNNSQASSSIKNKSNSCSYGKEENNNVDFLKTEVLGLVQRLQKLENQIAELLFEIQKSSQHSMEAEAVRDD